MIDRDKIKARYESLLIQRLSCLIKLSNSKGTKYNNLIIKLNDIESVLKLFELTIGEWK